MSPIRSVAVIGTGLIGASWAAFFLARGLDVVASDPADGAENRLREAIRSHWPSLVMIGLDSGASPDRLRFFGSAEEAVATADFVQESGPERLDLKRDLFRILDAAAQPAAILASSSSTLTVSEIQSACAVRPERVVLGHPFNPPHLIPLVELSSGTLTSPEAVTDAAAFYQACGKRTISLRKEIRGHVANRLQAALSQEAFHLVREGVVDVADIDAAIAYGPGLRWALLGPFVNMHLAGGTGGMAQSLAHLGPAREAMWRDLGQVSLNPEIDAAIVAGVDDELKGRREADLISERDDMLVSLLQLKARAQQLP